MSDRRTDPASLPHQVADDSRVPDARRKAEPAAELGLDTAAAIAAGGPGVSPAVEPDLGLGTDLQPEPAADDHAASSADPDAAPAADPDAAPAGGAQEEPAADAGAAVAAADLAEPAADAGAAALADPEPPFVLPLLAPEPQPEPADPPLDGRPMSLRLAGLHLRMGALAQARAELEALAGRGALDEDALVDLAEIRWRTGDLAGAGEAADAAIARGRHDGIALVIAAEAVAAAGRPSEARRLAARALGAIEAPLDPIFAGMPRGAIWPGDHMLDAGPSDAAIDRARAVAAGAAVAASAAAAEAFAGGRAAMNRGDSTTAAIRLGIAMRLDPGYARSVLDLVEDRTEAPLLALVAGDALRLLGREDEALEAYHQARGRVTGTAGRTPDGDDGIR
jgi:tetratricopeptide (TPR) repeat protein